MAEGEIRRYTALLPFQTLWLEDGFKYLGFYLKLNAYYKDDWMLLLAKLEKRFLGWSYQWLYRAGRLVLVKSALEAILFFWMSLSWIPKGILDRICKVCFSFLWRGCEDHYVMAWVCWEQISIPKVLWE